MMQSETNNQTYTTQRFVVVTSWQSFDSSFMHNALQQPECAFRVTARMCSADVLVATRLHVVHVHLLTLINPISAIVFDGFVLPQAL